MTTKMKYLFTGLAIVTVGVILYNSVFYVPAGVTYDTTTEVLTTIQYGTVSDSGDQCGFNVLIVSETTPDSFLGRNQSRYVERTVLDFIAKENGMCDHKNLMKLEDLIKSDMEYFKIRNVIIVGHRRKVDQTELTKIVEDGE